jgi:hypothetical protein
VTSQRNYVYVRLGQEQKLNSKNIDTMSCRPSDGRHYIPSKIIRVHTYVSFIKNRQCDGRHVGSRRKNVAPRRQSRKSVIDFANMVGAFLKEAFFSQSRQQQLFFQTLELTTGVA